MSDPAISYAPPTLDDGMDARRQDDLVLVTTPAVRARRHPWAVVALWGWQTGLALLASWPAGALARAAWGGGADGDAPLWAPGSPALLDWMRHDAHGLAAVVQGAVPVLLLGAVGGLAPTAAVMIALAYATRDRKAAGFVRAMAGGLRAFRPMLLVLTLVLLLQVLVGVAGGVIASAVEGWARPGAGEARAQQLAGLVIALTLAFVSVLGVIQDLARAAVVRYRVTGMRALTRGARTFRRAPVALWWSWAWRGIAGVAPVLAVAAVAGRIGGRGGPALVFLAVLHQAVVGSRAALHTSWLARALRAVDGAPSRKP